MLKKSSLRLNRLLFSSLMSVLVVSAPIAQAAASYRFRIPLDLVNTAPAGVGLELGSSLLSYSAQSLNLGSAWVGSAGSTTSLKISNTGVLSAPIDSVYLGANESNFSQTNDCGSSLAGSSSCTVLVRMLPLSAGVLSGELSVGSGFETKTIPLVGIGNAATAVLSAPVFAGTPEGSLGFASATLTNTGGVPLTVAVPSSSSVTGARFSFASTTCKSTLAAAASCTVTVQFGPVDGELAVGSLLVNTSAGQLSAALGSTGLAGFATISPYLS